MQNVGGVLSSLSTSIASFPNRYINMTGIERARFDTYFSANIMSGAVGGAALKGASKLVSLSASRFAMFADGVRATEAAIVPANAIYAEALAEGEFGFENLRYLTAQKATVLSNVSNTRAGIHSATNFSLHAAKDAQLSGGYAVDSWSHITLPKGTKVYGGLPGQSSFYTSINTLEKFGLEKNAYWKSLQVGPHPTRGYRPIVGEFELLHELTVPGGIVKNNPHLGAGGAEQYVINNFATRLRLLNKIRLKEEVSYEVQKAQRGVAITP